MTSPGPIPSTWYLTATSAHAGAFCAAFGICGPSCPIAGRKWQPAAHASACSCHPSLQLEVLLEGPHSWNEVAALAGCSRHSHQHLQLPLCKGRPLASTLGGQFGIEAECLKDEEGAKEGALGLAMFFILVVSTSKLQGRQPYT